LYRPKWCTTLYSADRQKGYIVDYWLPEFESALFYEVHRVLTRYARGVDRTDWALMVSAFHDDAIDDHGSHLGTAREFADFLKPDQKHITNMMHLNGNLTLLEVDREAREVLAETYCVGWQRLAADAPVIPPLFRSDELGDELNGARLMAAGNRYVDLLTERGGELRIARRTVVYEWVDVALNGDQSQLEGRTLSRRSRDDASYTTIAEYRLSPA